MELLPPHEDLRPLPFVPPRFSDETLWSWISRVGLYYGWSGHDFLRYLGVPTDEWCSGYFRDVDIDCSPGDELLRRLSTVTSCSYHELCAAIVKRSPATLWMDDRLAFCSDCWNTEKAVPYMKRQWINAWVTTCSVHGCSLVSVPGARQARRLPDLSCVWRAQREWAAANHVRTRREGARPRMVKPPAQSLHLQWQSNLRSNQETPVSSPPGMNRTPFERQLILLSGESYKGNSIARAFYNVNEVINWRNTPEGYDRSVPLSEPLGALAIRACSIPVGSALHNLIIGQQSQRTSIEDPLRHMITYMHGNSRHWLTSRILKWPAANRERWRSLFEWPTQHDVELTIRSNEFS